jgi:pimeloyl-ACP methyl ester carboxylesterase
VPLDHGDPTGPTTTIALSRYRATSTARIGSVFVNPGGPGGSGVDTVLFGFGEHLRAQLGGRFDVVGFDPRGVAASDPLRCFASDDELEEAVGGLPAFPTNASQESSFFSAAASAGARCPRAPEVIDEHMSTADVARDLDLLRRAVGDSKLTYLGFSYGSFLGATYAKLYPANIRALVIDGVLNPYLWSEGLQVQSDRVATQQEFEELLRLCDAAAAGCAFHEPGGAAARWEALAARLRSGPLLVEDPQDPDFSFTYTYDLLIADAASAMYAPESWPGYAEFFDQLADAAGEGARADRSLLATRQAVVDRFSAPTREADYPNSFESYYGNQCADTEYPTTLAKFRAMGDYAEAGSQFGPYWWWFNAFCAKWPVNGDRFAGPWSTTTSAPVLVVGNRYDGITDLAGARAAAGYLKGSRLLTYAGWGHTAYDRSSCATSYVNAYLVSGALPPAGTVCPANPNPFSAQVQATAQRQPMIGLPDPQIGLQGPVAGTR